MNGNVIIGGRDYMSESTLAAGSESATLPVTNIATQAPGEVWRTLSTDPAVTWVTVDMGGERYTSLVSLIGHNLTQSSGLWRVRLATDAPVGEVGSTLVYDSGWLAAWPIVEPPGILPWGVFRWGGVLSEAEAAELVVSAHHPLPDSVLAQFVRVDLSDATNGAGYLQAGRLFVSAGWQTTVNFDRDWEIVVRDDSRRSRSAGNVVYSAKRPRYRVLRLSLSWLTEGEAFLQAMDMDWRLGTTGDLVVIPRPNNTDYLHHLSIYGQIAQVTPIRNRHGDVYSKVYELEELR